MPILFLTNIGRSPSHRFGERGQILLQGIVDLPLCGIGIFSSIARSDAALTNRLFGYDNVKNLVPADVLTFILPVGFDQPSWDSSAYRIHYETLLNRAQNRGRLSGQPTCDSPLNWTQQEALLRINRSAKLESDEARERCRAIIGCTDAELNKIQYFVAQLKETSTIRF